MGGTKCIVSVVNCCLPIAGSIGCIFIWPNKDVRGRVGLWAKLEFSIILPSIKISGLYYKCFTIVIYDRNDSGQHYKTRITIIIDNPSLR